MDDSTPADFLSSLVSLEQLPLSRVKLDRSLIESIDSSARSQAIAQAIIALCQSLGLEITAEGIERPEQLAWLNGHAAMYIQGYLLSPPVPADELLSAISRIPARTRSLLASPATKGLLTKRGVQRRPESRQAVFVSRGYNARADARETRGKGGEDEAP